MRHILIAFILTLIPLSAWADTAIPGPVAAKVIKVYDGDTFTVEAYPYMDQVEADAINKGRKVCKRFKSGDTL